MSAREWKPGDVALVNGRLCLRTTNGTWEHGDPRAFNYHDHEGLDVRPVVVIDPEDREQVKRLVACMYEQPYSTKADGIVPQWQAALREFANPTPPKPDEPTGIGAVVEDAKGRRWVRADTEVGVEWFQSDPMNWRSYADIAAVRVLSEGVTEDGA